MTLRCLCEDLVSDWRDVSQQRGFTELRAIAASSEKDSALALAMEQLPTTARAAHPLVESFYAAFDSDDPSILRENISGLTDPHWWKQKISRWRGAATDAAIVGGGETWLCAGGLRAGNESRDFYVKFTTSIDQRGPSKYLPGEDDRRLQAVERKLLRREAWMAQLRLATLVGVAEVDRTGQRRTIHVPHPSPASGSTPLAHVTFEMDRVGDGEEEKLTELFVTFHVEDHAVPNLMHTATESVRSVIEPVSDAWRVLPGTGTSEIWSVLVSPDTLDAARRATATGALPDELASSALILGVRAHYTLKGRIVEATVEGNPVRGLCGQWFVPTMNPDDLPICPTCLAEHATIAD